jgi:hypothetical protein
LAPVARRRPAGRRRAGSGPPVVGRHSLGEPDEPRGGPAVAPSFTVAARRLGIVAALGTVSLSVAYAVTLVAGLLSLRSPGEPIGDPLFSVLEILILLLMPVLVALMAAVHAWAPAAVKVFGLLAVVFVSLLAAVTCGVHFVILTVGHQAVFSAFPWTPLFVSFTWPSVAYALDILAWDVFFALAVLFAAPVFEGGRLATSIRALLVTSGVLALAGLGGVVVGDMRLRNIGIVGYAGVFPVAAVLMSVLFRRATPRVA